MATAFVHSIQIGNGGVPKIAVERAVVGADGLVGDVQRNLKYHGGPRRAVCLYSLESIEKLQKEGHPIFPGSIGENITISGIEWASLAEKVNLRIGKTVILRITSPAKPCSTIAASFHDANSSRVSHKRHPLDTRWYARVLAGGVVERGDPVEMITNIKMIQSMLF
ncbi:MAG: MOSC domain-containing protein [Planctomycetota bacterium]